MNVKRGKIGEVSKNPSWGEVEDYTRALAEKIKEFGFEPHYVIGISRGGWVPAVLLSHLMKWVPFASIDIKKDGDGRRLEANPHINRKALQGANVLLVEDILETGKSAQVARQFLEQNGAEVRLACFFARDFSEIKPDFVLMEGLKEEIFFPWERFRELNRF